MLCQQNGAVSRIVVNGVAREGGISAMSNSSVILHESAVAAQHKPVWNTCLETLNAIHGSWLLWELRTLGLAVNQVLDTCLTKEHSGEMCGNRSLVSTLSYCTGTDGSVLLISEFKHALYLAYLYGLFQVLDISQRHQSISPKPSGSSSELQTAVLLFSTNCIGVWGCSVLLKGTLRRLCTTWQTM